jgi:cysteine synthase A
MNVFPNYSSSIKDPSIIQVEDNLFILSFHVMKLLPALHMLKKAKAENKIGERSLIVETSSGSFAYGIALACTELNLPFAIVTDYKIDPLIKRQVIGQKGTLLIVRKKTEKGGIQQARLNKLQEVLKKNDNSFWPCQYDNPDNQEAYHGLGEQLVETLGKDLILVGPVGSGGSTCGLVTGMRKHSADIRLVGVDTFNSVLFGMEDGPRMLRGLGNSILPKNLNHKCFDEIHWISASLAFHATRDLQALYGLFCGPTTGAAYQVAQKLAKKNPLQKVVFVSPDLGYRYLSSVYNDQWLEKNGLSLRPKIIDPIKVVHPKEAIGDWACLSWQRRSLQEMIAP